MHKYSGNETGSLYRDAIAAAAATATAGSTAAKKT